MGGPLDTKDPLRFDGPGKLKKGDKRHENFLEAVMRFPTKVSPTVFGMNLGDPLNLTGYKVPVEPPEPAAPPPPPDTTGSLLREISRSETDRQLRRSRRPAGGGGGSYGGKGVTGV